MSKEDSDVLGWYARHVMTNNPGFFGTPESWDPKLRRKADMVKKTLSIDGVGRPDNAYENLAVITRDEAMIAIGYEIHMRVQKHWIHNSEAQGASPEERIMGAVETALDVLQNGTPNIPPFKLVAADPLYYDDPATFLTVDGTDVVRRFETGQVFDPSGSLADGEITLTSSFADTYDTLKRRMWASSKDLFNTVNKYERDNN
jgi:hypothetical protein